MWHLMEQFLANYIGELAVTTVLALLAWSFRSWSSTLEKTTDKILNKLADLQRDFNQHRVDVERRVTRVETKIDIIHSENKPTGSAPKQH